MYLNELKTLMEEQANLEAALAQAQKIARDENILNAFRKVFREGTDLAHVAFLFEEAIKETRRHLLRPSTLGEDHLITTKDTALLALVNCQLEWQNSRKVVVKKVDEVTITLSEGWHLVLRAK